MAKKVKVERKPMKVKRTRKITEEQREALRERMKLMRAKKAPSEYKNISKMVMSLPDDDTYSLKNIKAWIKHNKDMIAALNGQARSRNATDKERRTSENLAASKKHMFVTWNIISKLVIGFRCFRVKMKSTK